MKYVVLIPARGGSKRFPRKNLYPLCEKSLLAHSILYSQRVLPDVEVYVSTDSEEIAAVARKYGAGVIERPAELSRRFVSYPTWLCSMLQPETPFGGKGVRLYAMHTSYKPASSGWYDGRSFADN